MFENWFEKNYYCVLYSHTRPMFCMPIKMIIIFKAFLLVFGQNADVASVTDYCIYCIHVCISRTIDIGILVCL